MQWTLQQTIQHSSRANRTKYWVAWPTVVQALDDCVWQSANRVENKQAVSLRNKTFYFLEELHISLNVFGFSPGWKTAQQSFYQFLAKKIVYHCQLEDVGAIKGLSSLIIYNGKYSNKRRASRSGPCLIRSVIITLRVRILAIDEMLSWQMSVM